ncbi:3-oxoacyl-[acyl-carrier-protein] reductase [Desulfurivibrio alkaliphilus]|uniref:3-oxoacyl-[acyl-carrier-protein] reductase n=1 Tax=Desulfurivibrio alkaliphilus (strain DSM 19089 / UNIQEM U267 / AHT2) TaxID=589865 RepID=D6Z356_DESAT|nr:3-oxoacyl-[acyl-carrier-protein] reductase [Desulfurivibrio alkaliphilus]ADH85981.1 3-oxoacyl-(acyl-carrier-protein) reductase [Desulfurivibrio alkaliphilus AHT 2]
MSLQDKVALVTGGSRGIGRAVALRLAAMGAMTIVNYVSRPEAAQAVADEIARAGGRAEISQFNVADSAATEAAIKKIMDDHGRLDILVNNAGITRDGLLVKMKEEQWDEVLATNLKGAFTCTKAVSRAMMKQRWGRIVNISSVIGFAGNAGQSNYAAAKAGLVGLTRSVARELAPRNITVNGVAPGYIVTDMTKDLPEEINQRIRAEIPLGVLGEAEDVAGAVAYLVSDEARYVTGQFIHVNGGMYMG